MDGEAYVGSIARPGYCPDQRAPERIIIMRIGNPTLTSGFCVTPNRVPGSLFSLADHVIRHIRVLPEQQQVLAIRTVYTMQPDSRRQRTYVELYNLPPSGPLGSICHRKDDAVQRVELLELLEGDEVLCAHISDVYCPAFGLGAANHPNPLSIYTVVDAARGRKPTMLHWMLWPVATDDVSAGHYYLTRESLARQAIPNGQAQGNEAIRILPGSRRALVWGHSRSARSGFPTATSVSFYTAANNPVEQVTLATATTSESERAAHGANHAFKAVVGMTATAFASGISSISWDEGLGRVCYVLNEGGTLHVSDFSHCGGMDGVVAD